MSNGKDCERKIALVTGSATGIGADIAINLAAEGYFVIVTGRDEVNLKRVVGECEKVAGNNSDNPDSYNRNTDTAATWLRADLLDSKQLDNLIEFVITKFQRLDVLVNNACWRGKFKQPLECDEAFEDFKQVMQLNISVPLYLINRCLIPLAKMNATKHDTCKDGKRDSPVVINISSVAGQVVVPLHSYSISKACLSEVTRQLTQPDIQRQTGILSVTISPGPILTDERAHHAAMSNMTLVNRVGLTKEVANLVVFAISNAKLFHGREITIDGGYVTKQKSPSS